jgi:hypothetical protein
MVQYFHIHLQAVVLVVRLKLASQPPHAILSIKIFRSKITERLVMHPAILHQIDNADTQSVRPATLITKHASFVMILTVQSVQATRPHSAMHVIQLQQSLGQHQTSVSAKMDIVV